MTRTGLDDALRPPNRARYETKGFAEPPASFLPAWPMLAPLALFAPVAGANRIVAVCDEAAEAGLCAGLGLAEARARCPGLDAVEADPAADARLLEAIADWCDRYTPLVALDPPSGLVLDISGCAHLFGGEKALADDLLGRLFHQGFAACAAVASFAGTALALVRHAHRAVVTPGEEAAAVAGLPVSALRLDDELASRLDRLGLKTLGGLASLPRPGLARRFGEELLSRLDGATGRAFRPISPRLPVPDLLAERRLFEPISLIEDIERILLHLAERLKDDLERREAGGRRFELSLFRVDGRVERLNVGASRPLRDPKRIHALFRERMKGDGDEFDAGFGYDLVKLAVPVCEPMAPVQEDLSGAHDGDRDVAGLLDRLGARLGEAAVLQLEPLESHWPERAQIRRVVGSAGSGATGVRFPRPLRLFERPEPVEATALVPEGAPEQFRWRRILYRVRRVEGPERIAPEWWRGDMRPARDYWRVEDEAGRRYWLFREGSYEFEEEEAGPGEDDDSGNSGDAEAEALNLSGEVQVATVPAWYLHGIFA